MADVTRLYRRLGIEEPDHIDIRAVAFELGLEVQFAPLSSCEARIIGARDRGIITVREGVNRLRQRFSIAHEIGHWVHHRGKALSCKQADIGDGMEIAKFRERIADEYGSRLLMPDFLVKPRAKSISRLTFQHVLRLAEEFRVSRPAMARRLITLDWYPCILVAYGPAGRRWHVRSGLVPDRWFPSRELDPESDAFHCVFTGKENGRPTKIGADAFFDRFDADRYELLEETIRTGQREVLTLLTITDADMLEDR